MYQKRILPYCIIPSTFSPQASSPLERSGRTDKILHPLLPKLLGNIAKNHSLEILAFYNPTPKLFVAKNPHRFLDF
jgi:hypothetical protein